MFTGIIERLGYIHSWDGARLVIEHGFQDIVIGESIAIDGICLTVMTNQHQQASFAISPETQHITTAPLFAKGQAVNLERAMQLSTRVGGHFVLGHIDQVAAIHSIHVVDDCWDVRFAEISAKHMPMLMPKGSVTVNGVSLTINEVFSGGFRVMLIPHTLLVTNLSLLKEENKVNVEFDYLARIVLNQTRAILTLTSEKE